MISLGEFGVINRWPWCNGRLSWQFAFHGAALHRAGLSILQPLPLQLFVGLDRVEKLS